MKSGDIIAERYLLDAKIGEGGMAAVWRASDNRLERPVAIKFLFMGGRDPDAQREAIEAFGREAKIAAAIRHRNVVQVLDFGLTGEGVPFMAMEVLEGATLGELLGRGHHFTVAEILRVMALALQGLIAAHRAGIVHRDLKPDNLFLQRDGDGFYPKLVDFGISKSLDSDAGRPSAIKTREGLFVGTPMYMSSEQATGIPDIDVRTDVYSMGVIMYEMLAERLPYDSEHVGELLMRIMNGGAPPLREVAPQIGKPLSDLVEKAMHVDRDQRFQTAEEMYNALMAVADRIGDATASLSLRPPAMGAYRASQSGVGDRPTVRRRKAADVVTVGSSVAPSRSGTDARAPGPPSRAPWLVAAAALLLAGGGVAYGLLSGKSGVEGPTPPVIVVENTPPPGGAGSRAPKPAVAEAPPEPAPVAKAADAAPRPKATKRADRPKKRRRKPGAAGLSQAFAEQQSKLAPCFAGKLDAAERLPALAIRFSIDRKGRVLSTRLSPETFRGDPIGGCIEKRARQIRFDPQPGPMAFNIPLRARVGG